MEYEKGMYVQSSTIHEGVKCMKMEASQSHNTRKIRGQFWVCTDNNNTINKALNDVDEWLCRNKWAINLSKTNRYLEQS